MTTDFDAKARTWDQDAAKLERAVQVAEGIRRHVALSPADTVLDYGCGTGLLGLALRPHVGHVTMADSSREMLSVVVEKIAATGTTNVSTRHLDLEVDPTPTDRWSLVCTLMALHHVRDVDAVLRRFHEILSPGGHLAISDLDAEDGSYHGEGFEGHRGFDRADLRRRLEASGFGEVRLSTAFEVAKGPRRYPAFLAVARKHAR